MIADYIEAAYPHSGPRPRQAFAAAKVRELITFMELHLNWSPATSTPKLFWRHGE